MRTRRRVLFVCTHNSARSQMAEGWLRQLAGDRYEVHSAGIEAGVVREPAIRAMAELGIDISRHVSESVERYGHHNWDVVITVCDRAKEACPTLHAKMELHWSIPDPSEAAGSVAEQMAVYRQVRDEIRTKIEAFLEADRSPAPASADVARR